MTTINDLKLAWGRVGKEPQRYANREFISPSEGVRYLGAKLDAMNTSFEWREGWRLRIARAHASSIKSIGSQLIREGEEGMRLIREHLK